MNRKSLTERAMIIQLLVEGNSMRSTSRIADCSINTVTKLLVEVGNACDRWQHENLVNLPCKKIEVDEIWSFCYAKNRNLRYGMEDYAGDLWTFTSICPDTKLVPTWRVGPRTNEMAKEFMVDLAGRMAGRIQLTSDGFSQYRDAVEDAFGADVDYGMLVKIYNDQTSQCLGVSKKPSIGEPDKNRLTTAHIERLNLTMRTSNKRFARRTNAFSKKIENHEHAVALHFFFYNMCRIHKSIRVSPAMAAGVADKLWSIEDMVRLTD